MTTERELYKALRVADYEPLACWRKEGVFQSRMSAMATDMSSAYYATVFNSVPHALQVFDRFHIVKLVNDKLSQRRRHLQREARLMDRTVLKGMR